MLGEIDPLRKKKLVFYSVNVELGSDGDRILKDGGRFWSERVTPPDLQPVELVEALR